MIMIYDLKNYILFDLSHLAIKPVIMNTYVVLFYINDMWYIGSNLVEMLRFCGSLTGSHLSFT